MKTTSFDQKSVEKKKFNRNCQTLFSTQNSEEVSKLGNNRVAVTALEVMANVHTESTDYVGETLQPNG